MKIEKRIEVRLQQFNEKNGDLLITGRFLRYNKEVKIVEMGDKFRTTWILTDN